jgi:hypothetical protein
MTEVMVDLQIHNNQEVFFLNYEQAYYKTYSTRQAVQKTAIGNIIKIKYKTLKSISAFQTDERVKKKSHENIGYKDRERRSY